MSIFRNRLLAIIANSQFIQNICNKIGISPQILVSGLGILCVIGLQIFLPKTQQKASNTAASETPKPSDNQGDIYHVTKVSDGDTINVTTPVGDALRVRFAFIDAPEKAQDFGQECRQKLEEKLLNQDVNLQIKETDQYGRQVAEVFYQGKSINLEALQAGCAWHYAQYHRKSEPNFGAFSNAQMTAQQQHIGLWASNNPQNPSDFRKAAKRQGL